MSEIDSDSSRYEYECHPEGTRSELTRLRDENRELNMTIKKMLNEPIQQELNEAKSRIADMEARERWVPVSDRLPEEHIDVLIMIEWDSYPHTGYLDYNDEWRISIDDELELRSDAEIINYRISGTVTHWRPLPDPPDEVTG